MLIDMKTLLDEATKKGYCVPAPSVFNALTIETAFSRAVKVHSPVILLILNFWLKPLNFTAGETLKSPLP